MAKYETVASLRRKDRNIAKETESSVGLSVGESYFGQVGNVTYQLYLGDSLEFLKTLKNESIHFCFTSPPYNCGVRYENYDDNKDWLDYEFWMKEIFSEVYRVLVSGAKIGIVIPTYVRVKGKRKILLPIFCKIMESIGFEVYDYITWVKAKSEKELIGVAGRSTAWGSYMLPSAPLSRPVSEIILLFKKPGRFEYSKDKVDITKEEFKALTVNVWMVRQTGTYKHPASFPVELVERAVKLYTVKEQIVLDPFSGIGSTMIASLRNERNFVGSEISSQYVKISLERVECLKQQRSIE